MSLHTQFFTVNNIKLSVNASVSEAFSVARGVIKRAGLLSYAKDYSIYRRSVDARRKPDIFFVYSVAVTGDFPYIDEERQRKLGRNVFAPEISLSESSSISFKSKCRT